ncbi:DUF523 domain-containing protein [Anaerocolumna sedimenticola]|uniref:DUF523 domain-containing protein n=1 Tax=Anaerocolumna sedimenticola TaxID=2696063 RepID=A0A6P1THM0_9FIRM|nr:DUF523 domain-containing protein [Anaerocolumna sedimenticola]QHQ59592.1 DUF523 domain-containing protein [Anaerocolumna sedimenticola]
MNILVSACLLGVDCRYCGTGLFNEAVYQLKGQYNLIPVCPEQLGGLTTPRNPVELVNGQAVDQNQNDFTDKFEKGARETLKIAKLLDCKMAVLKSCSPSCGYGKIYDGTFSGNLIDGNGKTAALLAENGIKVITEKDI